MSHISVFSNNRIHHESPSFSEHTVALGDWFLTPVRCLFNGNAVQFSSQKGVETIRIEREYASGNEESDKPRRNFIRLVVSTVLVATAVFIVLGACIKLLGYLAHTVRDHHYKLYSVLNASKGETTTTSREESPTSTSDPSDSSSSNPLLSLSEELKEPPKLSSRPPSPSSGSSDTPILKPKVDRMVSKTLVVATSLLQHTLTETFLQLIKNNPSSANDLLPQFSKLLIDSPLNRELYEGELIIQEYKVKGKSIGTQCIERFNTIERDIALCDGMIKFLKTTNQKAKLDYYQRQLALSQNRLYRVCDETVEELKKQKTLKGMDLGELKKAVTDLTWPSSKYFRVSIKVNGFLIAAETYISVPVNFRYQTLKTDEKTLSILRFPRLIDPRMGWFSLSQLNAMTQKEFYQQVTAIVKKHSNLKKPDEWAAFLLKQTERSIEEVRAERFFILEKQMLHMILAQVERNQEKIKQGKGKTPFRIIDVGLLNYKTSKIDKGSGWYHDESVQMQDMQTLFAKFKGKILVLDGTGPYVQGNELHLPVIITGIQRVTLQLYLLNISPQGHTENDGIQLDINRKAIEALIEDGCNPFDQATSKKLTMPGDEMGFPMARDVTSCLMNDSRFAVQGGCLSVKDRTGKAFEQAILENLPPPYARYEPFITKILDKEWIHARVMQDNTPDEQLKVNPFGEGVSLVDIAKFGVNHGISLMTSHWRRNSQDKIDRKVNNLLGSPTHNRKSPEARQKDRSFSVDDNTAVTVLD